MRPTRLRHPDGREGGRERGRLGRGGGKREGEGGGEVERERKR